MTDTHFAPARSWKERGKALLRVVLFLVLFLLFSYLSNLLLKRFFASHASIEVILMLANAILGVGMAFGVVVLAGVSGKRIADYGFGRINAIRNLLIGMASGGAFLAALLAVLVWSGAMTFAPAGLDGNAALRSGALFAVMFGFGVIWEEGLFRGPLLVELSRVVSFWPAAIFLSCLFGFLHFIKGGGETIAGGLHASLFGLVLTYAFRRTGSLFFSMGYHFGWNFSQSFIFGIRNSAVAFHGSLLSSTIHGPDWLTGGTVGPEGSILTFAYLVLLIPVIHFAAERPSRGAHPDGMPAKTSDGL